MKHRQLPQDLRERVRRFVQYKWLATRGVAEESILRALPTDLRRDIQRHLCLDLLLRVSSRSLWTILFVLNSVTVHDLSRHVPSLTTYIYMLLLRIWPSGDINFHALDFLTVYTEKNEQWSYLYCI